MNPIPSYGNPLVIPVLLAVALAACGSPSPESGAATDADTTVQRGDETFDLPDTGPPAFAAATGPRVGIDEAHHNYHTAGGRYRAFAQLLERDGYRVGSFVEDLTATSLASVDVLVISNAVSAANLDDWSLPGHAAFTDAEVSAVVEWVDAGGSLMLIADHMPMPGAAASLAAAFGVLFHDSFAYNADGTGRMTFAHEDGSLRRHPVTTAAGGGEIPYVTTFTGQAFRLAPGVEGDPLMVLGAGAYLLLPAVAWEFDDTTPRIPADGLLQGTLLRHGRGRVAVFGEAAAFSAQVQVRGNDSNPMGMNDPEAPYNARFTLNVMRWLTDQETP